MASVTFSAVVLEELKLAWKLEGSVTLCKL